VYEYTKEAPSSEHIRREKQRSQAFQGLTGSKAGIRGLVRYWLEHSSGVVTPNASECFFQCSSALGRASWANYALSARPPYDDTVFSVSEWRAFLMSASRATVPSMPLGNRTPRALFLALSDVWLAWLNEADIPGLFLKDTGTGSATLVGGACDALRENHDPSGLPRALEILQGAPEAYYWQMPIAQYVYEMGQSDGFEAIASRARERSYCGDSYHAFLMVADECQARAFLAARECPPGREPPSMFIPPGRLDLDRGAARLLMEDPSMRPIWEGDLPSEETRYGAKWQSVIAQGSPALTSGQLLAAAERAGELGSDRGRVFFLSLLGRKDSVEGTDRLIAYVVSGLGKRGWSDSVGHQAARVLMSRAVLPGASPATLAAVEALAPDERRCVVDRMLQSAGLIPDLETPMLRCGNSGESWVRRPNPEQDSYESLLPQLHPQVLFKLAGWVSKLADMGPLLAAIPLPEAERELNRLVEEGNAQAITALWRHQRSLPKSIALRLLANPALSLSTATYLRLRLSEEGDDEAYAWLSRHLVAHFGDSKDPLWTFQPAILDEAERRKDTVTLLTLLNAAAAARQTARPPRFIGPRRTLAPVGGPFEARLLSAVIRLSPGSITRLRKMYDLHDEAELILALQGIAQAHSARAESWLQAIFTDAQQFKSSYGPPDGTVAPALASALAATGTRWCRDKLFESGRWDLLANLGDKRVLEEPQPSSPWWVRTRAANAFLVGGLDQAIRWTMPDEYAALKVSYFAYRGDPFAAERGPNLDRLHASAAALTQRFPGLSNADKIRSLALIGSSPSCWSDGLLRTALQDPYAPVRMTALFFLLEHPRNGFEPELSRVETSDVFPWCRRLAREFRYIESDPLDPRSHPQFTLIPR
jgi:hypothetical protein